jgi:hypothetical protein
MSRSEPEVNLAIIIRVQLDEMVRTKHNSNFAIAACFILARRD